MGNHLTRSPIYHLWVPSLERHIAVKESGFAHVSPSNALAFSRNASKPLPQNPTFDQFRAIILKSQANPDVNYRKPFRSLPGTSRECSKDVVLEARCIFAKVWPSALTSTIRNVLLHFRLYNTHPCESPVQHSHTTGRETTPGAYGEWSMRSSWRQEDLLDALT
jgi:hypothetical protein